MDATYLGFSPEFILEAHFFPFVKTLTCAGIIDSKATTENKPF
jgi:hypothetical protein